VNVQESWSGTTAELGLTDDWYGGTGGAGRVYTVLCDVVSTAVTDALASGSIPSRGDAHPVYTAAKCIHKRATRRGPLLVDVTCEYYGQESPLAKPYRYSIGFVTTHEAVNYDVDGNLIINSAGDRIANASRDISDIVLTVVRNEATYPWSDAQTYQNAINADVYCGFAAGKAKIMAINSDSRTDSGTSYYEMRYQIQFRRDGWQQRLADEGEKYLTSGGAWASVKDAVGTERALLDGAGGLLPYGDAAQWVYVDHYTPLNFAALGLV